MSKQQDAISKLRSKGLISKTPSKWLEKAQRRAAEEPWKRRSQAVALAILRTLRNKKMSQKELAEIIGVSPQQVNKWVKGNENFTFETIAKLENALNIELMQVKGFKRPAPKLENTFRVSASELFKKASKPASTTSTEAKIIPMNNGKYAGNGENKYA